MTEEKTFERDDKNYLPVFKRHKIVLERGAIINCTVGTILGFIPPLIITREHADELIGILDGVLGG